MKDREISIIRKRNRRSSIESNEAVSNGALAFLGFWDIDVIIMTQRGRTAVLLKILYDDSQTKTRLCQYEAYNNDKMITVAKQIVISKLEG